MKLCQDCLQESQARMKYYYDRNRPKQSFEINDEVLLDARNLRVKHTGFVETKKLAPRFIGPFKVIKKCGIDTYELAMSPALKLYPVFHTSLLKPYQVDTNSNRDNKTLRFLLNDGDEGYLVEKILQHRKRKGKMEYLVKWHGYSLDETTWEPLKNLAQVKGLIQQYHDSI